MIYGPPSSVFVHQQQRGYNTRPHEYAFRESWPVGNITTSPSKMLLQRAYMQLAPLSQSPGSECHIQPGDWIAGLHPCDVGDAVELMGKTPVQICNSAEPWLEGKKELCQFLWLGAWLGQINLIKDPRGGLLQYPQSATILKKPDSSEHGMLQTHFKTLTGSS